MCRWAMRGMKGAITVKLRLVRPWPTHWRRLTFATQMYQTDLFWSAWRRQSPGCAATNPPTLLPTVVPFVLLDHDLLYVEPSRAALVGRPTPGPPTPVT